jgi:hypothetical protein
LAETSSHAPSPGHWRRWKVIAILVVAVVVLPVAIFAAWAALTLNVTYSTGERVGYIQKFSRKGWICKTWEGELAMVNLPGQAPQIFSFTVRDDAVARKVMSSAGDRVALTYAQHPGVPSKCFGETEYFITDVRPLGQ